jgi:hypothetical protein
MNASACLNNNDVINMFRSHLSSLTSGFIPIVLNSSHEHRMCHHKYIIFYDGYVFFTQRNILCPISSL